jgi:membrane-bound metal-dependent hydrolase YbcI (DUF457 family)
MVCFVAMNIDWAPLQKAVEPLWEKMRPLFSEHYFLTIVCAFFAVMMTISFYKFLRSINPALVAFIFLLIFFILILHWTFTRSEPEFLKPVIDWIAPFFPTAPVPVTPLPKK